jgi:hypothetical protein
MEPPAPLDERFEDKRGGLHKPDERFQAGGQQFP